MKKYHVWRYANGEPIIGWQFRTLEGAKAFFDVKVNELPVYRKRKNQQSVKKFHDNECWGYELYAEDVDGNGYKPLETLDSACMSWKEAKKAK